MDELDAMRELFAAEVALITSLAPTGSVSKLQSLPDCQDEICLSVMKLYVKEKKKEREIGNKKEERRRGEKGELFEAEVALITSLAPTGSVSKLQSLPDCQDEICLSVMKLYVKERGEKKGR